MSSLVNQTKVSLSASEFAAKWKGSTRTERAAAQEHFIDICRMLEVQTPNEADQTGEWYAFEKGAQKQDGGDGFADVWKRNHFAWEYKKKRSNLAEAYKQLLQYREALENPPLLVVCDLDRFEIHTNFTGTKKAIYPFTLDDLINSPAEPLRLLRAVMKDPGALRPAQTRAQITEEVAAKFAELARRLGPGPQGKGHEPHSVAHFLTKILFCLFAEDVDLLPRGLIQRLIENTQGHPEKFDEQLRELFSKMATAPGGHFGTERIEWFNGGLFRDTEVLPLDRVDLAIILEAAKLDWRNVEPAVLGTLFERGLDPRKRSQFGAHYTDIESILKVVEPVVVMPLRHEFDVMKQKVTETLGKIKGGTNISSKEKAANSKARNAGLACYRAFLDRLRNLTVLDPACGSGNFLYVTLQFLKDLEKEAIIWGAETLSITQEFPGVGPKVVRGIELNAYAAELARVTIWVGQIQWMIANGFSNPTNPILQPLDSVENRDAILDQSDRRAVKRAAWPAAEFIVGNPPFLGGKKLRTELGDEYVDALFKAWDGAVPREADLVCYWHEKARQAIEAGITRRAGLLATQGIRGGANQQVLKKIKETGDIFLAWQNEPWIIDGASVGISIVGQDDGSETTRQCNGLNVTSINADLSGGLDLTQAKRLPENANVSFMGDTKGGAFNFNLEQAKVIAAAGPNPNGKPNTDVVVPWVNSLDVLRRPREMYIVDFNNLSEGDASLYAAPFEYVVNQVKPKRLVNKRESYALNWWLHVEPRPAMRAALKSVDRFLVTPTIAKHRVFSWMTGETLPDHQLIVFARDDDYLFGILQSRVHELWALRKGTQLETRPRYTPNSAFETFPFPWPLNTPDGTLTAEQRGHWDAISIAAKDLNEKRERYLNPPELVRMVPNPPFGNILRPVSDAAAKELKTRTLTRLYNERPSWIGLLHKQLDSAVLSAYGLSVDAGDSEILEKLLSLNLSRAPADGEVPDDSDASDNQDTDE